MLSLRMNVSAFCSPPLMPAVPLPESRQNYLSFFLYLAACAATLAHLLQDRTRIYEKQNTHTIYYEIQYFRMRFVGV